MNLLHFFPRIERSNCLLHANWGHEVGHILVGKWIIGEFAQAWASDEPAIKKQIEEHVSKTLLPEESLFRALTIQEIVAKQMRDTMEVAKHGLVELLCDRVNVHIFGPSALAATMEFSARFAMDVSPLQSEYYPPWRYRLRKMFQHCHPDLIEMENVGYPRREIKAFVEWLKEGERLTVARGDLEVIESNTITKEAYKFIDKHWDEAAQKVISLLPSKLSPPYRIHEHEETIVKLFTRLKNGVPPNEIHHLSGEPASFQDIIVAAWAYKMDQIANEPLWGSTDDFGFLFRLVLKGCESSFVHSKWGKDLK